MVVAPDGVAHKWAVVVELMNAGSKELVMLRAEWALHMARVAQLLVSDVPVVGQDEVQRFVVVAPSLNIWRVNHCTGAAQQTG